MTSPILVKVENVSKRFVIRKDKSLKERVVNFRRSELHKEDFWALRDVDLEVAAGTTVGLIGPNGSGKSTLLKTIGGIIQPTSGHVSRRGRLAALLELGAGFHPDLTGRENVYLNAAILGLSQSETDRQFEAIVDFSGIENFIDTQVKFYSSGMYVRLGFAVAVHVDPDLLLVDEVLAVGDEPFQRKCMNRIRAFQAEGRTIVLVTHALDQVGDLCDLAVVLENGRVVLNGDPKEALRTLRADYEAAQEAEMERIEAVSPTVPSARVLSVELFDKAGLAAQTFNSGDSVRVRVTVESRDELDDWMLGIGINTPLGQVIYGTHTKLLGVKLPPLHGRTTVDLLLPDLALGEGQFTLHSAVATGDGVELHRLSHAITMTIHSDGRGVGVLRVGAELLTTSSD